MGRIGDVERLGPELNAELLRDFELAEDAEVEVAIARAPQRVVAGGAEAGVGDGGERERVEPRLATSDAPQVLDLGLDLVGALGVAARVE